MSPDPRTCPWLAFAWESAQGNVKLKSQSGHGTAWSPRTGSTCSEFLNESRLRTFTNPYVMLIITVCHGPREVWVGRQGWAPWCLWQFLPHELTAVPLKLGPGSKGLGRGYQALSSLTVRVRLEFAVAFKPNHLWLHSANSLILTTKSNENREKTVSPRKLSAQNDQISAPHPCHVRTHTHTVKSSFWYLVTFTVNNCLLWSTKLFIELSLHSVQQVRLIFPFH